MCGAPTDIERVESRKSLIGTLRAILCDQLNEIADESATLREPWEPLLDSLVVVSALMKLEKRVGFKIPPDKAIRKGGYREVDEAVEDILHRIIKLHDERKNRKGSK